MHFIYYYLLAYIVALFIIAQQYPKTHCVTINLATITPDNDYKDSLTPSVTEC